MQAIIRGKAIEMPISTVSVRRIGDGQAIFPFHCIHCGNTIAQLTGVVTKIVPIDEPYGLVKIISKCRHCGNFYAFQIHEAYTDPIIRLQLYAPQGWEYFYCYLGSREPLFQYNRSQIFLPATREEFKPPFTIRCREPNCPIVYQVTDLL